MSEKKQLNIDIILSERMVFDGNISDFDLAIICWLKYFTFKQSKENKCIINADIISFELYEDFSWVNKRNKERFRSSLKTLSECGYIKIEDNNNNNFIVDTSGLIFKGDVYVVLKYSDMHKALAHDTKINKYSLFRYFCIMLSMFRSSVTVGFTKWSKCPVGFFTITDISDLADIHYTTAYKYNNVLEDLKLVYIHRTNDTYINKDTESDEYYVGYISNTYGRYEDKVLVEEVAIKFMNEYSIQKNKKLKHNITVVNANMNRSLSTKYRWFCEDNSKYEYNEIKQLYLGLKEINKKRAENNRKDLTVFKEYDFYDEEETN